MEKVLQAHIAQQQPMMQALHAGVALGAQQTEKLNSQLQQMHTSTTSTLTSVSARCQAAEQDGVNMRRGLEQSLSLWVKQKSTNETLTTQQVRRVPIHPSTPDIHRRHPYALMCAEWVQRLTRRANI